MKEPKLSVAIITFQEADRVERCLRSVQFADEILVVDSGSTDQTQQIARDLGARVVVHPFEGHIEQKNIALSECTHDWVLCIDADEWLSPELGQAIQHWLRTATGSKGLKMIRRNLWLGRMTHFGVFGKASVLRLVSKSKAQWVGANPHDQLSIQGETEQIEGILWHEPYRSYQEHLQTIERYAEIASRELQPSIWRLWTHPPAHFVRSYILKLGFLDGGVGLILSILGSYYVWLKYWRAWRR